MKSLLNFLIILFLSFSLNAQVGIGTTSPNGALDIDSANNGLLIPRVALTDLTTLTVLTPTASEMVYNTTSNGTVEPGYYYLFDNGATLEWVRFGGSGWLLDGNTGVTASSFMGSLNDADVFFRRFNLPAGRIGETNTSYGLGALAVNTNTNNVAFGTNALGASINGVESVAIGSNALSGTTAFGANAAVGYANIAIGYNTLTSIAPGNDNVALGYEAAMNNTGSKFIAIGYRAGTNNNALDNIAIGDSAFDNHLATASVQNIAIGTNAMGTGSAASGQTTSGNVAIGYRAGQAIRSINNIAIGLDALLIATGEGNVSIGANTMTQNNSTFNTAIGTAALFNGSGSSNVAIGYNAGQFNGAGNTSVIIGRDANAANRTNAIAIGYQASATADNQIQLGNGFITQVRTSGVITAPSYVATVGAATGYADYVFENFFTGESKINSEYNFKSIEETEAFVKQNNHLPGIKSYNEIKKNDFKFSIDELSLSSLEKIEEQFLYITQLNKKIKFQEEELDKQEQKIKSLEARLERIEKLLKK